MDREPYIQGARYEKLMRRAYPKQKTNRNGVDSSKMAHFIEAESGYKFYGQPSAKKQLENLKIYMLKAIAKFKGMKWSIEEFGYLLDEEEKIEDAICSGELLNSVEELLELTDCLEPTV